MSTTRIDRPAPQNSPDIDLLSGGRAIAAFIGVDERRLYRMADELPIFRLGGKLTARRSSLLAAIERMERGEAPGR